MWRSSWQLPTVFALFYSLLLLLYSAMLKSAVYILNLFSTISYCVLDVCDGVVLVSVI